MTKRLWMSALAIALTVLGCSSGEQADDGTAPVIDGLALSPVEVEVGKVNTIAGTLTIDDDDGDVSEIGVDVTLPDGKKQSLPKTAAQGASGVKQGKLALALAFGPPAPGAYEVDVFVVDARGHESNRLRSTITAK